MSDDIIRMAREVLDRMPPNAHYREPYWTATNKELKAFAALVADAEAKRIHDEGMVTVGHMREQIAAEREACAKVCDDHATKDGFEGCYANACAESIRARGNT